MMCAPMPFGWLVLTVLTALAAVAVAVRASPSGRAELAILSALGFFALIEAPVLVLGYTRQLLARRRATSATSSSATTASPCRGSSCRSGSSRLVIATLAAVRDAPEVGRRRRRGRRAIRARAAAARVGVPRRRDAERRNGRLSATRGRREALRRRRHARVLLRRLYLRMHRRALTPSFQVIFFPSSYVRPLYEMPTS